ncbi:unnamed protein product [Scytosiphon promiscuus]
MSPPSGAGVIAMLLCSLGYSPSEASSRRTPFTAFAQATFVHDPSPVMPQHTATAPIPEVSMKPDLSATSFSPQNAFFFANLSKIAYSPEKEARGLVLGNSTYEGLGFDRFHWFEAGEDAKKSTFDAIHDTEAFVCANDDMIAVVFRGTKERADWAANLNAWKRDCPTAWGSPNPSGAMHEGFDDGVETVWESRGGMHQTIKALYNEKNKNRKLYIAGHSLGGALATVAAARLAMGDDMEIAAIYTIGSPRVFDHAAAALFDATVNHGTHMKDKYFRCRNNNDIVPRAPPGFQHVGTEIYLDRFGTLNTAGIVDRLLGRISAIFRGEVIDGIHDHGTSEYVRLFKQVVINSRVSLLEKAGSTLNDVVSDSLLKVAPTKFVEKSENLQNFKRMKSAIREVQSVAKDTAAREADLNF